MSQDTTPSAYNAHFEHFNTFLSVFSPVLKPRLGADFKAKVRQVFPQAPVYAYAIHIPIPYLEVTYEREDKHPPVYAGIDRFSTNLDWMHAKGMIDEINRAIQTRRSRWRASCLVTSPDRLGQVFDGNAITITVKFYDPHPQ